MSLPEVSIDIESNALGQIPPSAAGASVKLGICSKGVPNTVTSYSDVASAQADLGVGPLVEALADTLAVAGGPVYAVPLTPTTQGTVGSVTHTGTGAGTVVPSRAPAEVILVKISTGGALGTAQIQVSVNGGAYGSPVVSVAGSSWAYPVPGTLTTVTLDAQTYTAAAVWTIATTGAISLSGTGTVGWLTQASSPLDGYNVVVTVTTSGALGVAVFTYSVDGGNNVSGNILVPGSGVYAIPGTGVVLTFASTFVEGDTYTFTTVTAAYTTSDLTAGLVALRADPNEWGFFHAVGSPASASAAASVAAIVDTQASAAETEFRYVFGISECPTSEADATLTAAFASFASARSVVHAGDIGHISVLTGRVLKRNGAIALGSRIAAIPIGEDPAWVGSPKGSLRNVRSLYGNAGSTTTQWNPTTLDANRFATLRKHIGLPGYYVTNGNVMAVSGSDFNFVQRRRVMDVACRTVRAGLLPVLNQAVRINKKTGFIDERDAVAIERKLTVQLKAALGVGGPQGAEVNASDASVVVSRTEPMLTTNILRVTVRIVPLAYAKWIEVNIGFLNPALAAA